MLRCGFLDRQEKTHWEVWGNQECVNTPSHFIQLRQLQYFDLRMHALLLLQRIPILSQ